MDALLFIFTMITYVVLIAKFNECTSMGVTRDDVILTIKGDNRVTFAGTSKRQDVYSALIIRKLRKRFYDY